MNKVLTIIGARPQFIKSAPVSKALLSEGIRETVVHTGQHFDKNMSTVFFEEMNISSPKYNLGINSLSHAEMTGKMMVEIEKIILKEKPQGLLVYGDTNSTLAGALAAKKLLVPLIHIEAGLRSFNREMPEEINRIITDHISDYLFCPTERAVENLHKDGLDRGSDIVLSGDVMYDALLQFRSNAKHPANVAKGDYILCTLHRQENTDDKNRFIEIANALNTLSKTYQIVFPVHPRTRKLLGGIELNKNISLLDPVGYLEMLSLLLGSSLVLTDSGGLQKEAFFTETYCVTLRDETEWVELVENGYNLLVGASSERIVEAVNQYYGKVIERPASLYGEGNASRIIANHLSGNYTIDSDAEKDFQGILPEMDLKKNLGCG